MGRPEHARHLHCLSVARTHVVEDGVAEDVRTSRISRDVLAPLADVASEFELEVQGLAEARPLEFVVDADDREAVALVVDRLAVEGLDDTIVSTRIHRLQRRFRIRRPQCPRSTRCSEALPQMQLEAGAVTHLWRRLDWRSQLDRSALAYRRSRHLGRQ
ncbi:hypothetical protein D3C81_934060 [compost metagenome]